MSKRARKRCWKAATTWPTDGLYLHDGRLLTLGDTVDFFNRVLETKLTATEKKDLVAFLRQL